MLAPTRGSAQEGPSSTLGPSFTVMIMGGDAVRASACENTFFGAAGLNVGRIIAGRSVRFQAAARAYVLAAGGAICAVAPLPPPPNDGTYTMEDPNHLVAHPFLTTDARVDIEHRVGLQIDYQWLHLTNDRFERTFQGGALISEQALTPARHWSNAVHVGVRWAFGL